MARFSFRGILTSLDLAHMASTEPTLVALRRRMVERLGMSERQAGRVVENILGRALMRYGDHLVAGQSAVIDRVISLRGELDDAFHGAMEYNTRTATGTTGGAARPSLDAQLRRISSLLEDLDRELTKLGRPLHEIDPPPGSGDTMAPLHALVSGTAPTTARPGTVVRDVARDLTESVSATGRRVRARILSGRYRFRRNRDGSYTKYFDDGASARFRVENGRYRVEMFDASGAKIGEAHEFAVLMTPYGRRPRTTALMQANHGYQNSTMSALFGRYGYNGDAVPTVWMRDSRHGSPHGMVTAAQNSAKSARNASGVTLEMIREWTIADLRHAGMPDAQISAYLRAIDDHFMRNVYPNIPANRRTALLGNWRAGTGL